MANSLAEQLANLRDTRVWRSIFRSGFGPTNLHRALAVQQNVFLHLSSVKIRKRSLSFRVTWFLGTLSLGTFLILVATGIPLMLYYHPSVPQAYADMKDLRFAVSAGVFLRNLHRWSAHAMVLLVFAHLFKVFYRGAYRPPREFNWVIGVVLLILTMVMSFTGYLLPFDQRAYWATIVGVNINGTGPLVGPYLSDFLRGGSEFGATTLSRFYAIHMLLIPGLMAALIGAHLFLVAKLGTTAPPWTRAEKRHELRETEV